MQNSVTGNGLQAQFRLLLNKVDDLNGAVVLEEICKLVDLYSPDGLQLALQAFYDAIDLGKATQNQHSSLKQNSIPLLLQIFERFSNNGSFPTQFCQSLAHSRISPDGVLTTFSSFGISGACQLDMDLALLESTNPEQIMEGKRFLRAQLMQIISQGQERFEVHRLHQLNVYLQQHRDTMQMEADLLRASLAKYGLNGGNGILFQPIGNNTPGQLTDLADAPNIEYPQNFQNIIQGVRRLVSDTHGGRKGRLAASIEELGHRCMATVATMEQTMKNIPNIDEFEVSQVLVLLVRNTNKPDDANQVTQLLANGLSINLPVGGTTASWNYEAFIDAVNNLHPLVMWGRVYELLDHPDFLISDQRGFILLVSAWRRASSMGDRGPGQLFPLRAVCGHLWENVVGQLSFLKWAVLQVPEVFTFATTERKIQALEGLHGGKSANGTPNEAWLCADLLETLCKAADAGHLALVRQIMEDPQKKCLEVLICGLAETKSGLDRIQNELLDAHFPQFLLSHQNSSAVIKRVWKVNSKVVLKYMILLYERDETNASRILDVCNELKALTPILESLPIRLSIELATLASRREFLNLEMWMNQAKQQHGLQFLSTLLEFMSLKLDYVQTSDVPGANPKIRLSNNDLLICIKVLDVGAVLHPQLVERCNEIKARTFRLVPDVQAKYSPPEIIGTPTASRILQNPGVTIPPVPGIDIEGFSSDIEQEANSYYQKLYCEEIGVQDVIEVLKQFRASTNPRDKNVYACMLRNLFDEFRFFSKFPQTALETTADLFGDLLGHQLVSPLQMNAVFNYLSQHMKFPKDPNDKMFKFAHRAAKRMKDLMPPEVIRPFAEQLVQFPQLAQEDPQLYTYMQQVVQLPSSGQPPVSPTSPKPQQASVVEEQQLAIGSSQAQPVAQVPLKPEPTLTTPDKSQEVTAPGTGPSFNLETKILDDASENYSNFSQPDPMVMDKVHFIMNNLTEQNLDEKGHELNELIGEHHKWFANYLVVKRACQESNFQVTYLKLLDKLGVKLLEAAVMNTTLHYVKVFIDRDSIKTSSSDRQVLSNLGNWLGLLTVARMKPVKQKDLDLKQVLFDSYEKGKMIPVVNFVKNVLQHCKGSVVFNFRNPWIAAILSLLKEIHSLENIKISIQFAVENIFNIFEVKLEDVTSSNSLEGKPRGDGNGGNADFNKVKTPEPVQGGLQAHLPRQIQPGIIGGGTTPGSAYMHGQEPPLPGFMGEHQPQWLQDGGVSLPDKLQITEVKVRSMIANNVSIPQQWNQHMPQLRQTLPGLISKAIMEIIEAVMKRSVLISVVTTKDMIAKDFANEPDENIVRTAAHNMAGTLAGSLALVTCKEPLTTHLTNQFKNLFAMQPIDQKQIDAVVEILIRDNAELGCQIIENFARERAIYDIDNRLMQQLAADRQRHAATELPNMVTERLTPKPHSQLLPNQQAVYQDFQRQKPMQGSHLFNQNVNFNLDYNQFQSNMIDGQAINKIIATLHAIEESIKEDPNGNFMESLVAENARQGVTSLMEVLIKTMSLQRDDYLYSITPKIFTRMFDVQPSRMRIIAYSTLLEQLKLNVASQVPTVIINCYNMMEDETKYALIYVEPLIRAKLVPLSTFDTVLAKQLENGNRIVLELVFSLIKVFVIDEQLLLLQDLQHSAEEMMRMGMKLGRTEVILQLVDQAKRASQLKQQQQQQVGPVKSTGASSSSPFPQFMRQRDPSDPPQLREHVAQILDEWATLCKSPSNSQSRKDMITRIVPMYFNSDEISEKVIRVLTELSVLHCLSQNTFEAVDAFVRLFVNLIRPENLGVGMLVRVLNILTSVLQRDSDERQGEFNAKPYHRIFIGFINELCGWEGSGKASDDDTIEDLDPVSSEAVIVAISASLCGVQPLRIPGFSFAWLQLISHRQFMPRLLELEGNRGWDYFNRLMIALLKFLEPYLRNADLSDAARLLYKGTLRVLLVLLHDFPEFLCDHHFQLCDVIPASCIQMRNLILSAFPRSMRLPDPFTPNLKVDLLPDIQKPPNIIPDPETMIPPVIKVELDKFLVSRQPPNFLNELIARCMLSRQEAQACGTKYSVHLLNCIVLYTGYWAINHNSTIPMSNVEEDTPLELFRHLAANLDTEGRYLFLNACANQLRYPNNHTHYFSCLMLWLFAEGSAEVIQEQITRVLIERLIVNRPHPWGLLITFIELIKNPMYKFWSHDFTRCAPEIERLFESVARSCMVNQKADEQGGAKSEGGDEASTSGNQSSTFVMKFPIRNKGKLPG